MFLWDLRQRRDLAPRTALLGGAHGDDDGRRRGGRSAPPAPAADAELDREAAGDVGGGEGG